MSLQIQTRGERAKTVLAQRWQEARSGRAQRGFTLVELLVVITILGILAAIVVFSVGGIGNKGQDAACETDLTSIQTAEEAFFAQASVYASMGQLTSGNGSTVPGPLLNSASKWYTVQPGGGDPTAVPPVADSYTLGYEITLNPADTKQTCLGHL